MSTEVRKPYGLRPSIEKKQGGMTLKLQIKELPPPIGRTSSLLLSAAPQEGLHTGYEHQTVDEVTKLLSQIKIRQIASSSEPSPSSVGGLQDKATLQQLISEVLPRDLEVAGSEMLLPNHACFELARRYAKKWKISDHALDSHIKLACGYMRFPVILLLNPAPKHESLSFDQMVLECKTLSWIEDVLCRIGLDLGDVMVFDACTLLSTDRIRALAKESEEIKEQALSEAYDVTQKMLEMVKPNIIVSCQCSTSFSQWGRGGHVVARELCSSIGRAKKREVKKVRLSSHTVNVVQAYHPSGFLNLKHHRKSKVHHDPSGQQLEDLFAKIYHLCASWKTNNAQSER